MAMIEYFTFYDKSGTPYSFQVYPSIGEDFPSLAGVYMFTKRVRNQQQGTITHYIRYIGETQSFRDRPLDSGHPKWISAILLGFDHICIHPTIFNRVAIQNDLIDKYDPPLNKT